MPVTRDIVATYRGPGRVMRRLLAAGPREDRALAILMAGCAVMFVAQWPRIAREAHLAGRELNADLGASLLAWVFLAPLIFYLLALLSHWGARALGGRGSPYGARLALFWAFLASMPVLLLNGLVAGFIGSGPALQAVGLIWCAVFAWFWIGGLREAEWGAP
ncbi:YIP1 family protein [Roseovarius spongiae]|uniref:YIP1 family protein n=1 Tax=Roseovarius spongiae TaxID=2320272 RepID=A0A3A8B6U3_9RHOB|nr:YIP1 family protein [Roseovarius spongiae]RKF17045.1 YIP1 family protein [Roseovarius spongiae]